MMNLTRLGATVALALGLTLGMATGASAAKDKCADITTANASTIKHCAALFAERNRERNRETRFRLRNLERAVIALQERLAEHESEGH